MVVLHTYREGLGISTETEVIDRFFKTLAPTNRTYEFYVDWDKVNENVSTLRTEIALLSSLTGSENPSQELKELLRKYPEVAKAIPVLIAVHETKITVLEDFQAIAQYAEYDFSKKNLSETEIDLIAQFAVKTGITSMLTSVQNLRDYVMGVEVGSDTNGRKNRSGKAMENILYPILQQFSRKVNNVQVFTEKKFSQLETMGIPIPLGLRDRRFDVAVLTPNRRVNIETNFFSGGGSKPQEIVDSYINRHRELKESNWEFIWVTDGEGWHSSASQMHKAFEEMDFILNLEFIRKNLLVSILERP